MKYSDYEYKLSKHAKGRIEKDYANNWVWRIFTEDKIYSSNQFGECYKLKRDCKQSMMDFLL